jgi:hypothetical protein
VADIIDFVDGEVYASNIKEDGFTMVSTRPGRVTHRGTCDLSGEWY